MVNTEDPYYVSYAEAAEILLVNKRAIYQMVERGKLVSYTVMGKKALRRTDVKGIVARRDKHRIEAEIHREVSTGEELARKWMELEPRIKEFQDAEVVECKGCGLLVLGATTEDKKIEVPALGTMLRLSICVDCLEPDKWPAAKERCIRWGIESLLGQARAQGIGTPQEGA